MKKIEFWDNEDGTFDVRIVKANTIGLNMVFLNLIKNKMLGYFGLELAFPMKKVAWISNLMKEKLMKKALQKLSKKLLMT